MAMQAVVVENVHLLTASTTQTFSNAGTATRAAGFFLGSDVPVGVRSDCVFALWVSAGLATQNATVEGIAAARWHPDSASLRTEVSQFTHGYANAMQFAGGSAQGATLTFAQSGSQILYFPVPATAAASLLNVRIHPPYAAYRVNFTLSNTATAAVTHSFTIFGAFMAQGR